MLFLIVFVATLVVHVLGQAGVSYPKDECDWIGADRMHGAYLPIGVCKHIFNPYNLSTIEDDSYYSHMYVCDADGIVNSHAYQHSSFCQGDHSENPTPIYGDDYFHCSNGKGPCPYAVVRFYHQQEPESDQCIKSTDGWFSEAPMTTYQCLNITKDGVNEWYMLKCTQNGALIGIDYTENCQEVLNETIFNDGCSYKDLFVEMEHCDYWDEVNPIVRSTTTTTTTTSTTTTTTTNTPVISTIVTDSNILSTLYEQSTSTQRQVIDSDSDEYHHRRHSGSHSHDGRHDHYHGDRQRVDEEETNSWPLWFLVVAGVGVIFMMLCCCMTYKYMKQKQEIDTFAKIVEYTMDIEGDGDDVNEKDNTIVVEEGETITFK